MTDGLRFTCQRGCINCCDQDGFVYLTESDVTRAAEFVGLSQTVFEERYLYRTAPQTPLPQTARQTMSVS